MSDIVNKGRSFVLLNPSLNSASDTEIDIQTGYTPTGVSGANSPNIVQQVGNVTSMSIQCRTAADIQLRQTNGNSNFFTIKSGTVYNLDISPVNLIPSFFLRSSTGNVTAEIILYLE